MDFEHTSTSHETGSTATRKFNPKNIGVAVGILSLCALELVICLRPFHPLPVAGKRRKKTVAGRRVNRKTVNRKKFRYKMVQRQMDSCTSLPSFAEIGRPTAKWPKFTKPEGGIHTKKGWYFATFSGASGAISPKILRDHSFPIPHPYAKFCPNPSSFRGNISENVSQTHYNIGVKPVGFSLTMRW